MPIARYQTRHLKYCFCSGCDNKAIHVATHYYLYNDKITLGVCEDYLKQNKIKLSSPRVRKIIKEK